MKKKHEIEDEVPWFWKKKKERRKNEGNRGVKRDGEERELGGSGSGAAIKKKKKRRKPFSLEIGTRLEGTGEYSTHTNSSPGRGSPSIHASLSLPTYGYITQVLTRLLLRTGPENSYSTGTGTSLRSGGLVVDTSC
jgi:hypothetical protein